MATNGENFNGGFLIVEGFASNRMIPAHSENWRRHAKTNVFAVLQLSRWKRIVSTVVGRRDEHPLISEVPTFTFRLRRGSIIARRPSTESLPDRLRNIAK